MSTTKATVLGETRWVERHTNLENFKTVYCPIMATLDAITQDSTGWDRKSQIEVEGLLSRIPTSRFVLHSVLTIVK